MRYRLLLVPLCAVLISAVASAQISLRVNNIITVDATGEPIDNCMALRTVLGSIMDSSAANPYLVKLEPGDYDCGDLGVEFILVPSFVAVEGAGIDATTIRGTKNGAILYVLNGAELRQLTVINEGGTGIGYSRAVMLDNQTIDAVSARVSHIRAVAQSGDTESIGLAVRAFSSGEALLHVHHAVVEGGTHALRCGAVDSSGTPAAYQVSGSQLLVTGGPLAIMDECGAADSFTCVDSYNSESDPLTKSCLATSSATVYAIGDTGPAGGIVFYVTPDGQHGLEAAPVDQVNAIWGCSGTAIPGAEGELVGTGEQNTADIIAGCTTANIAADIAADYSLSGYEDWFLPSKDELNLMYQMIGQGSSTGNVGGFANDYYWSSSEGNGDDAWIQYFVVGVQFDGLKYSTVRVRAVRAF